ncbi:MAG: hypothetical protein K6F39_01795 [Lachnospiraceae bacterium]|nr:hypothetical protein [Lachnospiraceae bacterium]
MIFRAGLILIGIILILTRKHTAPLLDRLAALFLSGGVELEVKDITAEDDILNNKTKWRMIVIGYVIFILFAVFSIVSIFTLNSKINTLYGSVQNLEETVQEMQAVRESTD